MPCPLPLASVSVFSENSVITIEYFKSINKVHTLEALPALGKGEKCRDTPRQRTPRSTYPVSPHHAHIEPAAFACAPLAVSKALHGRGLSSAESGNCYF